MDNYREWVDGWAEDYPRRWFAPVASLAGKATFKADDLEIVYGWKFRRMWPGGKIRAMRRYDKAHPGRISDLTGRAFACPDELGALLIVRLIPGAGDAGASAVLAVRDPERYTVMDVRALRSLATLGMWDPEVQGEYASAEHWTEYLEACRALAEKAGRSLRDCDRALWSADGRLAR